MYLVEINKNINVCHDKELAESIVLSEAIKISGVKLDSLSEIPDVIEWRIVDIREDCNIDVSLICAVNGVLMTAEDAKRLFVEQTSANIDTLEFINILRDYFDGCLESSIYERNILETVVDYYTNNMKLVVDCYYRDGEKVKTVIARNKDEAIEKAMDENDHYEFWEVSHR